MDRMACLDLPAFPLQLLLRQHPEWRGHPVAVVDSDQPRGIVLWVNAPARAARILSGMSFAAALSLSGDLRAAPVPKTQIDRTLVAVSRRLRDHSPHVEPSTDEPGVFWLDASGLEPLYGSLDAWAAGIETDLSSIGLSAVVVVGFRRFATYALAKSGQGVRVLREAGEEQGALQDVPLERLAIAPGTRDALAKLGVHSLGAFLRLPSEGIRRRYGKAAFDLHRMASGELNLPLQPERPVEPVAACLILDRPETDAERLMSLIEMRLPPLLEALAGRGQVLEELRLLFRFERLGEHKERIRPAAPTLDVRQILELIRLRLSAARLPDGVEELHLLTRAVNPEQRQLELLAA
ncbi:DNA polymerase Y family protein, partial [Thiocapsa sp.]|uniref:DNA polymerase Y family protein n=1 Tax=Thiocapsa sp. TaxID=2024551 RepID=UPI00359445A9